MSETTYQKRIIENFESMGTPSKEWRAVPIIGVQEVDVKGKLKPMPLFDFPKNYSKAPTLYPLNTTGDMNCELCGRTPIKTAYYIQNDDKKWTLVVGSECVKNFEDGKSGKDNLRQFKINSATILANDLKMCADYIKRNFSRLKEERDWRGFVKKTRDWKSIYFGNAFNYTEKEQLRELFDAGKLDVLIATRKSSLTNETIYMSDVFEKLPLFFENTDSDNYEKQLLSWYKRNEQKGVEFLTSIEALSKVIGDEQISFESTNLTEPDKFEFGGNLINFNYSIGGL